MPRGKKKVVKTEQKIEESAVDALCNHQNKHYTAGELTCVLPKNHGGDHLGYVNDKPTAWSDAAGKPVKPHA